MLITTAETERQGRQELFTIGSSGEVLEIDTTTRHRVMIAPQRHDVHKGHAYESHVFEPAAPVQVTVRK